VQVGKIQAAAIVIPTSLRRRRFGTGRGLATCEINCAAEFLPNTLPSSERAVADGGVSDRPSVDALGAAMLRGVR